MRILGLFDMYFLTMMIIQGSIVLTVDAKSFKNAGNDNISRKAHTLGWLAIIISMILFILRAIF